MLDVPTKHVLLNAEAVQLEVVLPVEMVNVEVELLPVFRSHAVVQINALIGFAQPFVTEKVAVLLGYFLLPLLLNSLLRQLNLLSLQIEKFSGLLPQKTWNATTQLSDSICRLLLVDVY